MVSGIRNTLPDESASASDDKKAVTTDEEILEQWERVSEAWNGNFAAYLRYIGYTERR